MNLVVMYLTRNSLPRRLMRHANESQSATVLALGNSLMLSGFNEALFNKAAGLNPPNGAVNLALGATVPVDQLLLLRYALAQKIRPRVIIYGFYDFQLTAPNRFSTGDLIGNHSMLYYFEPLYARQFYSLSFHDSVEFRAMRLLPMLEERGAVWAKIELFRRALAQQGMPYQRSNQFGRISDFSLLESASADDFRRKCEASANLPLAPPVEELFREAHNSTTTLVVVEMPMSSEHVQKFYSMPSWSQYVEHLKILASPYNVLFIDASKWIGNDSLFLDSIHLSHDGAAQFSERLGELLSTETVNF